MAHITLNTNTTTSPAALALPDNARIVIIDADTNIEAADLVISGAESLIIFDGDVQITTDAATVAGGDDAEKVVADEKAYAGSAENHSTEGTNTEDHSAEGTNTGVTETSGVSDPATLTVVHTAGDVDPIYIIGVNHDKATGIYTDSTTGTEVSTDIVSEIIYRAYDNDATAFMTFDIPGHGVTTFVGDLFENYNGHAGITLVGANGGAYVLNPAQELTDDMTVLNEARFIFSGNPDVIFDNLDINIIDAEPDTDADTEADAEEDCVDENAAEEDSTDLQHIRTYDADAKLYVKISSQLHKLKNNDVRRIVEYAATHDLSLRLMVTDNDVAEPYVGRLQPMTKDPDNAKYLFIDKKFGTGEIDLDEIGEDAGFDVLEVYSDADMRRRGFAGTNHADYDEVLIVEMLTHINTALDM